MPTSKQIAFVLLAALCLICLDVWITYRRQTGSLVTYRMEQIPVSSSFFAPSPIIDEDPQLRAISRITEGECYQVLGTTAQGKEVSFQLYFLADSHGGFIAKAQGNAFPFANMATPQDAIEHYLAGNLQIANPQPSPQQQQFWQGLEKAN